SRLAKRRTDSRSGPSQRDNLANRRQPFELEIAIFSANRKQFRKITVRACAMHGDDIGIGINVVAAEINKRKNHLGWQIISKFGAYAGQVPKCRILKLGGGMSK